MRQLSSVWHENRLEFCAEFRSNLLLSELDKITMYWYTLYTKPNAEYQVASSLQQRGIQTYLPEIASSKADEQPKRKPFFPCYLFFKVDLEVVGFSQVRSTPGLRRIVACDDRPVPLPDGIIDLIRKKLGALEGKNTRPTHPFEPGDTVRITNGPFQDMQATFDGPTTPTQRVQVLLQILGHVSRVQIDATDLEKASVDSAPESSKRHRRTRGRGRRIKGAT